MNTSTFLQTLHERETRLLLRSPNSLSCVDKKLREFATSSFWRCTCRWRSRRLIGERFGSTLTLSEECPRTDGLHGDTKHSRRNCAPLEGLELRGPRRGWKCRVPDECSVCLKSRTQRKAWWSAEKTLARWNPGPDSILTCASNSVLKLSCVVVFIASSTAFAIREETNCGNNGKFCFQDSPLTLVPCADVNQSRDACTTISFRYTRVIAPV